MMKIEEKKSSEKHQIERIEFSSQNFFGDFCKSEILQ